ncbi:hypothetical protein DPMN_030390 [Dreissena polymorpha]|uniref:Uncharacterized protein n=1 Tax=Dreissena polymorpha TaxID=45954 RepID=A0A9D4M0T0_DREPO|nr:hypothetical protein DPMN_030390 [Dreissena polymorpha]
MEEAHERNKAQYQPLLDECRQLWKAYAVLGLVGMARRRAIADVCRQAESA